MSRHNSVRMNMMHRAPSVALLKRLSTEICPPVLKILSTMKELREQEADEPDQETSQTASKSR